MGLPSRATDTQVLSERSGFAMTALQDRREPLHAQADYQDYSEQFLQHEITSSCKVVHII